MFAWIDPRHQGGCGTEYEYVSGDTLGRSSEVHWSSATTPPSGKEKHCIQPGRYTLSIFHNNDFENPVRTFDVDYVATMTAQGNILLIHDATAGVEENIEKQDWNDTSYLHRDLNIRVDLGSPGYSDSPVLYGDSAGDNPYANATFADAPSLSGTHHTWFRFSSVASTSTQPPGPADGLLSRIYWDSAFNLNDKTGFWDSYSGAGIIRIHQFTTDTMATRDYVVGLETMRPDEQPRTTPEVTRAVHIQGPPPLPPPLTADIQGPTQVWSSGDCTWTAAPTGGVSPYHYQWYYRRQGESEVPVGTDAGSYTRYITVEPTGYVVWIRVVVTDAAEQAAGHTQLVEVGGGAHPLRPNCS